MTMKTYRNFSVICLKERLYCSWGYGLEEAEVLEHILRREEVLKTSERRRFSLQGFFRSQEPLYKKLYKYYEISFGVHLVGFERDKKTTMRWDL